MIYLSLIFENEIFKTARMTAQKIFPSFSRAVLSTRTDKTLHMISSREHFGQRFLAAAAIIIPSQIQSLMALTG